MDGKKIPESCTCYHVRKRLETVNKYLAGYNQHQPLTQTDPTATTIAMTSCLWGINRPWTYNYPGFYTLDPDIQAGITIHENEHRQQCINMGQKRYMELQKEKEYVLEVPAYTKERDFLEGKLTEKCK
ncbi:MAG: hypothetical protein HY796_03620 [Elusimicrobia bacterium]|nr:hypothetical protein [Elusimicrobiota bacterium]